MEIHGNYPEHQPEIPLVRQPEYYRTTSRNTVTPSLGIHTEMVFVSIYYHYY